MKKRNNQKNDNNVVDLNTLIYIPNHKEDQLNVGNLDDTSEPKMLEDDQLNLPFQ